MKKHMSIAIDGPSGVGKSTLAKNLSERLGYAYVDTGAMFRTFAVLFLDKGIAPEDEEGIRRALEDAEISIRYEDGVQRMILNGSDVTDRLRTEEVSHMASVSSQYSCVRERLLSVQRELAKSNDVIMDGRDIGTVVLPDAGLKVFLTAESGVRALRRYNEYKEKGILDGRTVEDVEKEILDRDYRDSHRDIAPLKAAEDAFVLDTSRLNADEVTERIIEKLNESKTC